MLGVHETCVHETFGTVRSIFITISDTNYHHGNYIVTYSSPSAEASLQRIGLILFNDNLVRQ